MTRDATSPGARRPRASMPVIALALAVALLGTACGGADPSSGQDTASASTPPAALTVVATTSILGDVTAEIAGDAAQVATIMPPGSDPHSFEASAQEMARLQEADLVVANGGNLEQQLAGALEEAEGAGVPVFHALDHVDTLTFAGHGDGDGHEHGAEGAKEDDHAEGEHEHGSEGEHEHEGEQDHGGEDEAAHAHDDGEVDPHFWMDPARTAAVARALGAQIAELTGGDVEASGDAYATRLEELDAAVDDQLATIPDAQRKLVTNHEAFGYFADRYGFEIVGTVIPSVTTGAEPSARDLEDLAAAIEREQVGAIFAETTAPDQLATTLAQEVGADVTVVELYSGSLGEEGSEADSYVAMLRTNADRISTALDG